LGNKKDVKNLLKEGKKVIMKEDDSEMQQRII
jgi:hypothetical protein